MAKTNLSRLVEALETGRETAVYIARDGKTAARELILNPQAELVVSAASIWEISIKHSLGRGDMPISGNEALSYVREAEYTFLGISPEHIIGVENLPHHHADPIDPRRPVAKILRNLGDQGIDERCHFSTLCRLRSLADQRKASPTKKYLQSNLGMHIYWI